MDYLNEAIRTLPKLYDTVSVYEDDDLLSVIEILKQKGIGCVPVLEQDTDKIIGVFTERDYLKKVDLKDVTESNPPIRDYMTENPKCLSDKSSIAKAALLMRMGRFRHVIVTNDQGGLDRVLSIKDVLDWIFDNN